MTTALHTRPAWIPTDEIATRRFDPLYYDPALAVAEHHYHNQSSLVWKRLREISKEIYSFGAYELTNRIIFVPPGEDSVPFINITEVGLLTLDLENARHIDRESHKLLYKSVCRPGTLLLSMSGSIGKVAVVPCEIPECNSNQRLAKVVLDAEQSDPYFAAAYFASSVGQASCFREAAGAIQKELYLYNIEELPTPCPPKSIRTAIGNKLRAAERLRQRAIRAVLTATEQIGLHLPQAAAFLIDQGAASFSLLLPQAELDGYFGAQFYAPRRRAALLAMRRSSCGTQSLGGVSDRVRSRPTTAGRRYHVSPAKVDRSGYWSLTTESEDTNVIAASTEQVLFLRMRPNLNRTTIVDVAESVTASAEYLAYRFDRSGDAYFVVLCLRQPFALAQVVDVATGDRPRVDAEFIDDILLPWPPPEVRDRIGNGYKSAFIDQRRADSLAQAAILDVEALIDGSLDEAGCLAQGRQLAAEFSLEAP